MRVAIRTDASSKVGTGHVMRCLTLADELRQKGAEVLFICRELPGNIIKIIQDKNYEVCNLLFSENEQYLKSDSKVISYEKWLGVSLEQDAEETYQILSKKRHIDWLIVDHYAMNESWESKQRSVVSNILVIDDLADRKHNCDLLLDQNYYEAMESRYVGKVSGNCRQLLGPEYVLLRKEFREVRQKMPTRNGSVHKVFVFFGGVDLSNMTEKVIDAIIGMKSGDEINVDVVIGSSNPHREKIESLCSNTENFNLHIQVENMARMMADADLCIGSGGTVTWERCCLGLPSIAWPVAENQKELLKDSAKAGLVYSPDFENPEFEDIAMHIKALFQNSFLRKHISQRGLATIDGRGAIRVANAMLKQDIELRPVAAEDKQKIFEWRNDISIRKYSRCPDKINFDQHSNWFERVFSDPDRHVLIGSIEDEEIGVLRFDISGDQAEISIYLVPVKQGFGYGAALVTAGEDWLKREYPGVRSVIAEVLPENKASIKLFEISGYKLNGFQYLKSIS